MASQLLSFKKITALPSNFEKGCVYFYSNGDARSILLGTGTTSTSYLEFKGTDQNTWRQIQINGSSIGTDIFNIKEGEGIDVEASGGTATVKLVLAGDNNLGGFKTGFSKTGNKFPVALSGEKAYVEVPLPTAFTISASATDDDVVILTGTAGSNGVTYDAKHAKVLGNGKSFTGTASADSIAGYDGSGTLNIPKINVNQYGHITSVSNEQVTITMPSAQTAVKNPNSLKFGSKSYDGSSEQTITAADLGLDSALKFHGTSSTAITDGSTTQTVTLSTGSSHKAENGCVLFYGNKEFVWNGSSWEELGNEGDYKVKQTAVSSPAASGTTNEFIDTISQNANGVINPTKKTLAYATTSAVGGIKVHSVNSGSITVSSNGSNYYGVNRDKDGKAYVALPTWSNNAGTVTSITPGTGLTGTSNDTAITTSGTINLKSATTTELGGIKVGTVNTNAITKLTDGSKYYAVNIDKNGLGYVALPDFKTTDNNTTYSFTGGTNKFTVTPSSGNAYDVAVTPSIDNNVTYTGTVSATVAVFNAANSGVIKSSGYTIASSVPANAKFTDTTYTAGTGLELSGTTFNAVWADWDE